jgi:hypothetical protein
MFQIIIHKLLNHVAFFHPVLSSLHFNISLSFRQVVHFYLLIVNAFVLVDVEFLRLKIKLQG